jgi:ppGpp synthetase/RelA/SpoT-type nucleotidyltranferase
MPVTRASLEELELVKQQESERYTRFLTCLEHASRRIEKAIDDKLQYDLASESRLGQDGFDRYDRGNILVYSRVKSLKSVQNRLEERYESLEAFPDLVGCRVVVVQRAEIGEVIRALGSELWGHEPETINYYDGLGRNRGYSGRSYGRIPIAGWINDHVNDAFAKLADSPEEDLPVGWKWELQVHTAMEEAWSRYSHAGFYKSEAGVPAPLQQRMRQLAASARLIDDSLRQTSLDIAREQSKIGAAFRSNERAPLSLPLDESILYECRFHGRYGMLLERLRDVGRGANFRYSAWPSLVKVGDETDLLLEVCRRNEIKSFGRFAELLEMLVDNRQELSRLLQEVFELHEGKREAPLEGADEEKKRKEREDAIKNLFDRPLLVFSVLILFAVEDFPRVENMSQDLWTYIRRSRPQFQAAAVDLCDQIQKKIETKEPFEL